MSNSSKPLFQNVIHFPKWNLWCEQCVRDTEFTQFHTNRQNPVFQFRKRKAICNRCRQYTFLVLNVSFDTLIGLADQGAQMDKAHLGTTKNSRVPNVNLSSSSLIKN